MILKTERKGNTTEHPIIKKYAREIKELTIDANEAERDIYGFKKGAIVQVITWKLNKTK